jgi:hypothetical protein
MLPTELWKHIALQYTVYGHPSPAVYAVLSLVSRMFIIPTPSIQEYYLHKYVNAGDIKYKLPNGNLHSPEYGNLPAVTYSNGLREWYRNGKLHREIDPAVINNGGDQFWYIHGKRHRDNDMPAVMHADGRQYWYVHGKLHRDNNLPAIIDARW